MLLVDTLFFIFWLFAGGSSDWQLNFMRLRVCVITSPWTYALLAGVLQSPWLLLLLLVVLLLLLLRVQTRESNLHIHPKNKLTVLLVLHQKFILFN